MHIINIGAVGDPLLISDALTKSSCPFGPAVDQMVLKFSGFFIVSGITTFLKR